MIKKTIFLFMLMFPLLLLAQEPSIEISHLSEENEYNPPLCDDHIDINSNKGVSASDCYCGWLRIDKDRGLYSNSNSGIYFQAVGTGNSSAWRMRSNAGLQIRRQNNTYAGRIMAGSSGQLYIQNKNSKNVFYADANSTSIYQNGGTRLIAQSNGVLIKDKLWVRDWDNNSLSSVHFAAKNNSYGVEWQYKRTSGTPVMELVQDNKTNDPILRISCRNDASDNTPRIGTYNGTWQAIQMEVRYDSWGNWPDYVFDKDYDLMSLTDLKKYIDKNHHLPGVKSKDEIVAEGKINLSEQIETLLQKVEELTLYTLEQQEEIESLKSQLR